MFARCNTYMNALQHVHVCYRELGFTLAPTTTSYCKNIPTTTPHCNTYLLATGCSAPLSPPLQHHTATTHPLQYYTATPNYNTKLQHIHFGHRVLGTALALTTTSHCNNTPTAILHCNTKLQHIHFGHRVLGTALASTATSHYNNTSTATQRCYTTPTAAQHRNSYILATGCSAPPSLPLPKPS